MQYFLVNMHKSFQVFDRCWVLFYIIHNKVAFSIYHSLFSEVVTSLLVSSTYSSYITYISELHLWVLTQTEHTNC